jgi:hypothetical protein
VNATHPFNVFNDFNHESMATRYFSSRVMEHWLQEYKLDGFRFDLSKGFTQTNSGSNVALWGQYDASRIAIWKRYYDTMQLKMPGSYVILEHFADNTEEIELSDYGMMLWGNAATNFQEAAMGFLGNSNFDHLLYNARGWSKPHLFGYMESHDEERMMYKNLNFGNSSGSYNTRDLTTALKRMEMSASYLLNMPGPKLIWEFGELGYDFSINRCIDGSINNNCRLDPKPIRWDYLQQTARKRLHDVYASLLKLRAEPRYKDVFIANNISVSRSMSAGFKWMTIRSATDSSMLCVIGNFDVNPVTSTFTFPSAGTWYDYLNGTMITTTGAAQSVTMQPGEYHVFLNRNITNAVITPVTNLNGNGSVLFLTSYPNPVQPNSVIEIYTPVSGKVEIELLNGLGQRIATLHSGFLSKGNHILQFKGVSSLAAGNYLIKASSGTSNTVHRVSVLK